MTTAERRRRIDEICDAALDRQPEDRAAYVGEACGDDWTLRAEVEALLARVPAAERFLTEPLGMTAAQVFGPDKDSAPNGTEPTIRPPQFPAAPFVVLGFPIVLRAAIFAVALATESWSANPSRSIIPAWAQILQAAFFASLAVVLLQYGRGDPRAWSLGLFILDAAATLLSTFVRAIDAPTRVTMLALHLRTDAFQAAILWFFGGVFPTPSRRRILATVFFVGTVISLCLGAVLVASDIYAQLGSVTPRSLAGSVARALRHPTSSGRDWYFTLQFLLLLPLIVALPFKFQESRPSDRRRFTWLVLGIVVGFLPLAADTILLTVWPPFATASGTARQLRGAIIVIALTAVPVAAAYAALVQRTLDVRLVIRAALQYMLARSFIRAAAVTPFVALVIVIAVYRERSVTELLSGPLGIGLAALTIAGVTAAMARRRLMTALDSRFYRQEVDARAALIALGNAVRRAKSLDDFVDILGHAIDQAFYPSSVVSAIAADDALHAIDVDLPPLSSGSALAQMLATSDRPIATEAGSLPLVSRLAARDREWLQRARAVLVVPLRGPSGVLLGVVALGEKKSELPYSDEDQSLLTAVGSASGLALHQLLAAAREEQAAGADVLANPSGRECVECGTVYGQNAIACACGGLLQRASVPYTFGDRLRFLQRIGAGGAGVVYRAIDLRLQQLRAVKTLPGADPAIMSRMRREARAMAAATHRNLAILHGVEVWRGAPMLVMEFLEGGTLADRLRHGRLSFDETLTLGMELSNALAVLHKVGILHRDIKPSNIGFSVDGVPKLLDFGLAKLVATAVPRPSVTGDATYSTWSTEPEVVRGTPAYLSPSVIGGASPSVADDIWSLTVTLVEGCTGSNPYRAATVAATIARVLTDERRVAEAIAELPAPARDLFADVLISRNGQWGSAQQFGEKLRQCAIEARC